MNGKPNIIDPAKEFSSTTGTIGVTISEYDRLRLATQILFFLAIACVAVFGTYVWIPENKGIIQIFELFKIGVLPLVTLVITFYFPNGTRK
jgi:hypothetical protein